jgi:DNA-binding protein H-NS
MPHPEVRAATLEMFAESAAKGHNISELRRRIEKLEIADLTRRIERLEKLHSAKPGEEGARR